MTILDNDTETMTQDNDTKTMTQTQRHKHKGTNTEMKCPPNYIHQNYNKAAMRVHLISLAALLSLELMTTV